MANIVVRNPDERALAPILPTVWDPLRLVREMAENNRAAAHQDEEEAERAPRTAVPEGPGVPKSH